MKKYGLFTGLLMGALLMASQALALVNPPAAIVMPPTPDIDGTYMIQWTNSTTTGAVTVLEEATIADFSDAAAVYTGSGSYAYRAKGTTPATYYYRVKATKAGDTDSAYVDGANGVEVANRMAAPASVAAPATDADGNFTVVVSRLPSGSLYIIEESTDGFAADSREIYRGTTYYKAVKNGATVATYSYRARAGKAGVTDSAPTAVITVNVAPTGAVILTPPASVATPATDTDGSYTVVVAKLPSGSIYVIEESTDGFVADSREIHRSTTYYKAVKNGPTAATYSYRARTGKTTAVGSVDSAPTGLASVTIIAFTGSTALSAASPTEAAAWSSSGHANANNNGPGTGSCATCHAPTGEKTAALNGIIGCEGCHGLAVGGVLPDSSIAAITSCNKCHETYNADGSVNVNEHTNTIIDTHFDNPATAYGSADVAVEGYVIRNNGTTPCTDCHGHQAKSSIHTDWASSAHAGHLTSAVPDTSAVWGHYNWDQTSSRGTCQRCHTSTGAMNFLSGPATYVAAGTNNSFSHLSNWNASTGSPQNELLYCWGCHSDVESGALRNPGAITETYLGTGTGAPSATIAYPNVAASNVCMGCHLGQKVGQNIAESTGNFADLSFINSHYLAAGGMVFNVSGYEYPGQTYNSYGFHKQVGVANTYSTGTAGPCVTCHMTSDKQHSFEVVTKDDLGVITAVVSTECSKCHGGLTASVMQASKDEFHLALEELKAALYAKGIEFSAAYPYFYVAGTTTAFKNWDGVTIGGTTGHGKDVMGAAFNYNLLEHDPGAYAHNRDYALKLIQDSIDYLADGVVDGTGVPAAMANVVNSAVFTDVTTWAASTHPSETNCSGCHVEINNAFTTGLHKTREGKKTFYDDHLGDGGATEIQKGFGNYVTVAYTALPCAGCHNGNDNGPWDTNPAVGTNVQSYPGPNCLDCHTNKPNGLAGAFANTTATTASAPVVKQTCYGCHSRQVNEATSGLTDVHFATMGCAGCHSTDDMHGDGTAKTTMLEHGAITAQCENCHGDGKSQGALSTIGEHMQHQGDIACSTCHAESMITCHNCHFDNEAGYGGSTVTTKAKFFSGKFGGTKASGNSWRFLVNRKMEDGSYKVYPGSMQSLVADGTDINSPTDDGQVHTHAGIAPYYSHAITKDNALRCSDCHGTQNAIDLYEGRPVRVTTWSAADGVIVPAANVQATFIGPKGVIPVPENPRGKLLMDFVDLTGAYPLASSSPRILVQRDGPESIHMPEAYVKPLTPLQIQKLAAVQFDHASPVATSSAASTGFADNTCKGCHAPTNTLFASSLHSTRQGKETFYNNNLDNPTAESLQKGFGNYVTVAYNALPCADCHNAAAWKVGGVDTWATETGGNPVCTDCHTNKVNGVATTTFDAPVAKTTCIGCHSRQKTETDMGLTDVHTGAEGSGLAFTCPSCHASSDMHGDGTDRASQLADGAISAKCENCHTTMASSITPEHTTHLANIACSTCHMESVITCYGCHFDNEASDPADPTILHAKFASGKFGGTAASGKSWRFLVNRIVDGTSKIYPASMQSLVADRTASNAPGEDNQGWTHAAIAPYYSHSITRVNALKCDKCHGIQNAINLNAGQPVRVVKWNAAPGVVVPVASMMANYTAPSGVIPVPENPVGKLLMDFVDLVNPAAGPLNASGTSPSDRVLFQADGPDTIHMPEAYVTPLSAAQIGALATPQVRP